LPLEAEAAVAMTSKYTSTFAFSKLAASIVKKYCPGPNPTWKVPQMTEFGGIAIRQE